MKSRVTDVPKTTRSDRNATLCRIKDAGRDAVARQQRKAAARIGEYESIARDAAETFRSKQFPALAERADTVAGVSANARSYLTQSEPEEIWHDAEDCVRGHSALAFTCFFTAGLVAGRFLKSSSYYNTPDSDSGKCAAKPPQ